MQIVERHAKTDISYADDVVRRGKGLFQSKETRDRVYKLLQSDIYNAKPVKSITTGQQLHPEYVTDYVGTLEIGFGNTMYQTYFSKLYCIDLR